MKKVYGKRITSGILRKKIRIIITSSRGSIALGRVESLKSNSDYEFYILGIDASQNQFRLPYIDHQIRVPFGFEKKFVKKVKEVAIRYKIDVIVPTSDYEVLAISKHKENFKSRGIGCVCSDYIVTSQAIDKAKMLTFLKGKHLTVPRFIIPKSIKELVSFAKELGYPEKTLIFKPAFSGGGNRGVWLIRENFGESFLKTRSILFISLGEVVKQIGKLSQFPKVVVMEYLPGEEYSVDGLAENGQPIYILPRVRVVPLAGYSQEGLIKKNDEVKEYVSHICRIFGFDSNFNVQLKYDRHGKPMVYEVNPRISATIVANRAAGIDLLLFGILKELNIDYPKNLKFRTTRMIRFWTEFYTHK